MSISAGRPEWTAFERSERSERPGSASSAVREPDEDLIRIATDAATNGVREISVAPASMLDDDDWAAIAAAWTGR